MARYPFPARVGHVEKRTAGRTDTRQTPLALRAQHVHLERWLGSYIRDRAGQKLGKHALDIQRVTVRFDDVNGPKHGLDIVCRVKVELPALPSVVAEERGTDPREAFDKALAVAELALVRTLDRHARRKPRHGPVRPWV